jgi:hypothetical protein
VSNLTDEIRLKGRQVMSHKAKTDESAQRAAALIGMYRSQGLSYEAIAEKLNSAKFRTRDNKAFLPMQVYRIYKRFN